MTNQTEIANVPVTDIYDILPIANELLVALTYEDKDSDHVADALAQFETQAVELSRSLGGDLTTTCSEQQQRAQSNQNQEDNNYSIVKLVTPILDDLLTELSHGYVNKDIVAPLLDKLGNLNHNYVEKHINGDYMDNSLMDRIEEERLLIKTAEDANIGNKAIFTAIIKGLKYDYNQLTHA